MKTKLYIFLALLCFSISSFAQQRSVCDIVPLYHGKYPLHMMAKYKDQKMEPALPPGNENFIIVSDKETTITIEGKVVHKFLTTSPPRSGIEYFFYDENFDTDVNVFIVFTKDEETKDKYFGIFVRYDTNLEYVFTYKVGTRIKE